MAALAIDSRYLAESWMPDLARLIFGRQYPALMNQFYLQRVSAYATVIRDVSPIQRLIEFCSLNREWPKSILDWQADREDDLDDVEVFHHLTQLAAATGSNLQQFYRGSSVIRLIANAHMPELPIQHGQGAGQQQQQQPQPLSSFRPFSIKVSMFELKEAMYCYGHTDFQEVIDDHSLSMDWKITAPKIIGIDNLPKAGVLWCMQFDFVDLLSSRNLSQNVGKRRRLMDPFIRVDVSTRPPQQPGAAETSSDPKIPPEAKRFRGVRYRPNRRTWIAEMKPPELRNKVSFGDFKSQIQAARAVDVAFHYFGKRNLLNFPETTLLLPAPPNIVDGADKLEFVKKEVKRLFMAFTSHGVATGAAIPTEVLEPSRVYDAIPSEHLHSPIPTNRAVQSTMELNETVPINLVGVPRLEAEQSLDTRGALHISSTFRSADVEDAIRSPSLSSPFPLAISEHRRSPSPSSDSQGGFISLWGYDDEV